MRWNYLIISRSYGSSLKLRVRVGGNRGGKGEFAKFWRALVKGVKLREGGCFSFDSNDGTLRNTLFRRIIRLHQDGQQRQVKK